MDTTDTTFAKYPDIPEVTPIAKDKDKKPMSHGERWIEKQLKKERKMLRRIKELLEQQELKRQEAEAAAAAKAAKKAAQKTTRKEKRNSFWDKVSNAIVKAIPALLTTALGIFAKHLFQRKPVIA